MKPTVKISDALPKLIASEMSQPDTRRIVSDAVLGQLADALVDGAELRIATDDPGYLEWILMHMRRQANFDWQARRQADWRERPGDWPQTRYEAKAVAAGRQCAFLTYRRRPRGTAA